MQLPGGSYIDMQGLGKLRAQSTQSDMQDKSMRSAAQHFESLFLQMMVKSMREAGKEFQSEEFSSNATKMYQDLSDKQLAINMAQNGGLGLADNLVRQMNMLKGK